MSLWTIPDLLKALKAEIVGTAPCAVENISIDSRTTKLGDLFFAIKGENFDGHQFVEAAFEQGACAAVVDREHASKLKHLGPLFVVRNVLDALVLLGMAARERSRARIVGVTGSVGKTGVKEALRTIFSEQGLTHASPASFNNHWGVPLTLARMLQECQWGIFEIGMNHAYEIAPLTGLVRPHVAIVITVEPVHLEHFPSVDAIADAKSEIFSGLEPGGTAILNRDNPYFERMRAHAMASDAGRIITFGEHEAADVRAVTIVLQSDSSIVEAQFFGQNIIYRIGAPGRHLALNGLSVMAAVHAMGGNLEKASETLAFLTPPEGRGMRMVVEILGGEIAVIDESYNANPASMRAAFEMLGRTDIAKGGRRIAVIADMKELGPKSPEMHQALVDVIESNNIDQVFMTGTLMHNLWDVLPHSRRGAFAMNVGSLKNYVLEAVKPGDVIMIKGSNSMRLSTIVQSLRSLGDAKPAAA